MKSLLLVVSLSAAPAWAQEGPSPESPDEPVVDAALDAPSDIDGPEAWWECRRMVGLTGGLFQTPRSWAFSSQGPVQPAGSPVFAMTCDRRRRNLSFTIGAETAPFFRHPVLGSTDRARQWLSVSVGVTAYAGEEWAFGPLVSADYGRILAGARALHLLWGDERRRLGFEYRLQGTYDTGFGVQASVLAILSSTGKKK